ncbi:MAG: VWA domain-containing protein, partial [Arcobacter sp.]|uniref:vWA domain-containing protein n=2 Tax=Arcobacter sp. TaxID=1872629 RepID=UPI003D058E8C
GQEVTIYAGEYTPRETIYVETDRVDDYYKQDTTTFEVSISEISNTEIDITDKKTEIIINDDVDPINITITATAIAPKIIDVDTEFNDSTGISISAIDTNGNDKNIAVIKGTDHDGFGVYGKTTGDANSAELGNLGNGESEKIVINFEKDVNSLDIAFAWRNNTETARVTFINDNQVVGYAEVTGGGNNTKAKVNYYTPDGELIKSVEAQGGTDRVDLSYTFELPDSNGDLVAFDKVEFTAPNYDDDYLINKIVYKEVVDTDVTDIVTEGGKVTFDIQLDENYPPQGSATATVEINGVRYENVIINATTGRATITVDSKDLGDLSNVVVKVIEINGGNYEKVNQVEKTFDFTPVLESSDDSITTNEDTPYILKVNDFGDVSVNTKEFKITELPNLDSGKLYLLVKEGETIIDKEGNLITVTQDTKIEIYKGQIITLADVGAGKLIFEPTSNSDIDGNLKFEVGDGNGNFSNEYTTAIEIIAVADEPVASINVTKVTSSSISEELVVKVGTSTYDIADILVNKNTYAEVKNVGNNTETAAQNIVVNENLDSNDFLKTSSSDNIIVINGDISGGAKIEPMGGNDFIAILGNLINGTINDSAGTDTLYLGKDSSYYSWNVNVHSGETGMDGTITQYADEAHTQVIGTLYINNIEGIIFADGKTLGEVEIISTPSTTVDYEVDMSAALVDTDGSETLTIQISGVPEGATFDLSNMTNLGNGIWEVVVPQGETSINYNNIKMTVPSEVKYVDLQITAKSTEQSNSSTSESIDSDATIYAVNESEQVNMQEFKYNLVLTIDNSGSMKGDKITLAKAAMVNLINKYDDLGEVKVLLNVFNAYGDIKGVWVDPSKAISLINAISAGGGTNYDDALLKNITALENNPAPLDGKTISYFVSDGVPTYGMTQDYWGNWYRDGNGSATTDVNDKIVNQWKDLDIDKTYSIGIGTSELNTYMREISQNPNEDVIIISDANDLSNTLENTVQELLVDGNVINNVVGGDGEISIDSIEVDGKEYTKDDFPEDGLLLGDNDIKFTFDFETGDYKYYAKSSSFIEEIETFKVNASDSDGDKTSFDVSANVKIVQEETSNIQNLMGEDIDLTTVITKNTDVINLENSTNDKITIELEDMLVQEDKQLVIKGDDGDVIELDNPSDWSNAGTEQLDGINYNVYTGTGENSTVKLLIEDDIDITPDI